MARKVCQVLGGDLAIIENIQENEHVFGKLFAVFGLL